MIGFPKSGHNYYVHTLLDKPSYIGTYIALSSYVHIYTKTDAYRKLFRAGGATGATGDHRIIFVWRKSHSYRATVKTGDACSSAQSSTLLV